MSTVWIYEESWGEWEDRENRIVGIFTTKEKANEVAVARKNQWGDGTTIDKYITEVKLDEVI